MFRDPVHGFIEVFAPEEKIIDTPTFQRLRRIRQLAFTNYVYHGAEHTRFPHSIGVMYCANRILDSVIRNVPEAVPEEDRERTTHILRLYGLLHDIGHGPFSHASEEFFEEGTKHETISAMLTQNSEIAEIIDTEYRDLGINAKDVADLIRKAKADPVSLLLRQIMDSDADADKMDYLLRDSLHCGVAYGRFDSDRMLLSYSALRDNDANAWRLAIREGGLYALESFVLARYWMFIQVYFHAKRRFWDIALVRFVSDQGLKLPTPVNSNACKEFLAFDDDWLRQLIVEASNAGNEWAEAIAQRHSWKSTGLSVGAHVPSGDRRVLNMTRRSMERMFGERVIFDLPEKAPQTLKNLQVDRPEEESIVLLNRAGAPADIMVTSEVVGSLKDKIRMPRVYAREKDWAAVEAELRKLQDDAEGDD